MKLLILSPRLPHAFGKADSMTVYRFIKFLSKRHQVYLSCFYSDESELKHMPYLKEICQVVKCVKLKRWKIMLNMGRALFKQDVPLQNAYYSDDEMLQIVDELIEKYQPDLAYGQLFRVASYLAGRKNLKTVIALQLSQTLNYRRMIANITSPFYTILYNIEYKKVRRYEPAITRKFDSCLYISKYDKESLDGHENIHNVFLCPHGIDVDYYTPLGKVDKEKAIVFCGVMETPTNIDAVLYFHKEIYPLVKKVIPDVRFYVVGKKPAKSIKDLVKKDDSVVVTGFLDDIRPIYEKVQVGIDPLRIGAGMQNKLLVGMCMGTPMVSTSIANEGIGAEPDKHLLIADEPKEFAAAVVELLNNEKKRQIISTQARAYVEKYWTWEYHFEILEKHLEDLVAGKQRFDPMPLTTSQKLT